MPAKKEKLTTRMETIGELKRELKMRETCYPKWIQKGTLNRHVAHRQYRRLRTALRICEHMTETEFQAIIDRINNAQSGTQTLGL